MTIEALPPDSRARKLVSTPPPFNAPPITAKQKTITGRCHEVRSTMYNIDEIVIIAPTNQRKLSSLDIRFVDSFCVMPLIPQKTRASAAYTNHTVNEDAVIIASYADSK
jgi:hypothetical protein